MSKLPKLTDAERADAEAAVQTYVQADNRWNDYLAGDQDKPCENPSVDEQIAMLPEGEREAAKAGHGRYHGNCGHLIKQCRCSHNIDIRLNEPCGKCKGQ